MLDLIVSVVWWSQQLTQEIILDLTRVSQLVEPAADTGIVC